MINKEFIERIRASLQDSSILLEEPMKSHTTFRVGGNADAFISVSSTTELQKLLEEVKHYGLPYFVCGNGSNLLISDEGYPGVIINIGEKMNTITIEGNCVKAQAGAFISSVSRQAALNRLSGLEFAQGIPGTVGGAIVMNAGAYDGEMKDVIKEVTVLDEENRIRKLSVEELQLGYRESILKHKKWICLEVVLELQMGNSEEIFAKMTDFAARRKDKQPLEYPSAGSTFKRPEGNYAGKLIMDAGLRGFSIGGAQVSQKHCGFIINTGDATAQDVYELIDEVIKRVELKFHVTLEPEVILLGEFK